MKVASQGGCACLLRVPDRSEYFLIMAAAEQESPVPRIPKVTRTANAVDKKKGKARE